MKKSSVFDSCNRRTESGENFEQSRSQDEIILKWEQSSKPLVSICCETFNHSNYIEQCLKGFLNQETTFPFEILIHDDASTDDTAKIIQQFVLRYPKLINPIFQTENQYSKNVGIWRQIQFPRAQGKYIALCEGDDYWTDPHKLQMQIDWLEKHLEYSMCCSDAAIISPNKELNWSHYKKDTDIPINDMILGGGEFIQTCTILFKRSLLANYPQCCKECAVGDYPLQLWSVLNGKVRYFASKTGAYRVNHPGSWSRAQTNYSKSIPIWTSILKMIDDLDSFTSQQHHKVFQLQQERFIVIQSCYVNGSLRPLKDIFNILSHFPNISNRHRLLFIPQKLNYIYFIIRTLFIIKTRKILRFK